MRQYRRINDSCRRHHRSYRPRADLSGEQLAYTAENLAVCARCAEKQYLKAYHYVNHGIYCRVERTVEFKSEYAQILIEKQYRRQDDRKEYLQLESLELLLVVRRNACGLGSVHILVVNGLADFFVAHALLFVELFRQLLRNLGSHRAFKLVVKPESQHKIYIGGIEIAVKLDVTIAVLVIHIVLQRSIGHGILFTVRVKRAICNLIKLGRILVIVRLAVAVFAVLLGIRVRLAAVVCILLIGGRLIVHEFSVGIVRIIGSVVISGIIGIGAVFVFGSLSVIAVSAYLIRIVRVYRRIDRIGIRFIGSTVIRTAVRRHVIIAFRIIFRILAVFAAVILRFSIIRNFFGRRIV